MNYRARDLLEYLRVLKGLNEDGYHCEDEIKMVIEAINKELEI